ncbi:MAG: tetratricopeptide repeat protein [Luteitalea sp.]|nr:tetratricopeptide repeat protein [Luteitalea sp.]
MTFCSHPRRTAMIRSSVGQQLLRVALALTLAIWAAPGAAQTTGMIQGKVVDDSGKPVQDAQVVIEFKDMAGRKLQTKTNNKGEYIQVGLQPGAYVVTASKEGVGSRTEEVTVRVAQTAQVDLELGAGDEAPPSPEDQKKAEEATKLFNEGVAASNAGKDDEAVQKFTETAKLLPSCYECHYNIGLAHMRKNEADQAEAAFKKAIEANPKKSEPYGRLAALYSSQKKFDEAAAMSTKANELGGGAAGGGGGGGEALFDQGVNLWNAGKIDEAIQAWEQATKADPKHAAAHYQLGLGYLNKGQTDEAAKALEAYLQLEPNGKNAEQAKGMLATLKQ